MRLKSTEQIHNSLKVENDFYNDKHYPDKVNSTGFLVELLWHLIDFQGAGSDIS